MENGNLGLVSYTVIRFYGSDIVDDRTTVSHSAVTAVVREYGWTSLEP